MTVTTTDKPKPTLVRTSDPAPESTALAVAENVTLMFERLATNPDVDVAKLEKLIAMQERILAYNAKAEYYAAFAAMQGELPIISEKGEIVVNGQVRSTYARNEDIQRAVKPILQKHGFALSFRNEFKDALVTITGVLSHRSGHSEQDTFIAKADDSGSKNAIQALGSTRAYGQRYTTIALLNIATTGEDDDGQKSGKAGKPDVPGPTGFDEWLLDMETVAEEGTGRLMQAWNESSAEFRRHLVNTDRNAWEGIKRKAAKVGKGTAS
jgi:hypothetical protein